MRHTKLLKAASISLLIFPLLLMFKPANAAQNGQQIKVSGGWSYGGRNVTVRGTNQNGELTTWSGRTNNFGDVSINGWWWKGDTTVTIGNSLVPPPGRTCTFYVPEKQFGDWVTLTCRA